MKVSNPPGIFGTVLILLRNARRRALARGKRQHRLIEQRAGRRTKSTGMLSFTLLIIIMAILHSVFAIGVKVVTSARLEAPGVISSTVQGEAAVISEIEKEEGSDSPRKRKKLLMLELATPVSMVLGSFVLLWWFVMMVCQGEGLEVDLQRRRHPMWEWLFSHPVAPAGIFLAEMLSPIAANPVYIAAPLFWGLVFGFAYNTLIGLLSIVLIGVPMTVAVASLGKAIEIGITLRFSPRPRGAVLGIMSWLGYALMMAFVFCIPSVDRIYQGLSSFIEPLAGSLSTLPFRLLFGIHGDGSLSYPMGLAVCWTMALSLTTGATVFAVWAARAGIAGETGRTKGFGGRTSSPFTLDPLYRKELLWLRRDGSALVQTLLVPLTIAGFQVIHMKEAIQGVQSSWNLLCGASIVVGTYFLWVLGPKSLASEGPALWIASTWPRGLESLLKAKARLWSLIATVIVFIILIYAAALFPKDAWKILLIGVGWGAFSRTMAEKSVTLVTVPSSSGEPEPIPKGRRWAASLGMLTFSIGVFSQDIGVAIRGIVFSWLTAAAMWQNFRARIPFLFDVWSEKLPPPPTLMHSMVATSGLVELAATVTAIAVAVFGAGYTSAAQPISYGLCGVAVVLCMRSFLLQRDVDLRGVWVWKGQGAEGNLFSRILIGAAVGGIFGVIAHLYFSVLLHLPYVSEAVLIARQQALDVPVLFAWSAVFAIGLVPFVEEYLFRGLLYRALDREWGGWRAIVGSAAFYAVYYPPLLWLPVGSMAMGCAYLYKRTGSLETAMAAHLVYNAVVTIV